MVVIPRAFEETCHGKAFVWDCWKRRTVGDPASVNFFHNMGTGFDSAVGGKLNDQFLMHVDHVVMLSA